MKNLLALSLFCSNVFAAPIMICNGEYALCAASGSKVITDAPIGALNPVGGNF
jgi:hypothetical protein